MSAVREVPDSLLDGPAPRQLRMLVGACMTAGLAVLWFGPPLIAGGIAVSAFVFGYTAGCAETRNDIRERTTVRRGEARS